MTLRKGRLWYPLRLTSRSLPKVYPWLLKLERIYAAQTAGAITAMNGFAVVAGIGSGTPALRAIGPRASARAATRTPRRPTARKPAQGLVGTEFELYLVKKLGGRGSFKAGGREFDGAVGNRWYEAKSGRFWQDHTQPGKGFNKFKSDIGSRARIAREHGATYEVHSNTSIPRHVRDWLTKKGIPFFEH